MSYLEFRGITHGYDQSAPVLNGLDLQVRQGEFVTLIGRSGCGKTTLLKLAAGLLEAEQGSVTLQGAPPAASRSAIGVVFQAPTLLEWASVLDNVLLPIALRRKTAEADLDAARRLLALMGLAGFEGKRPGSLSGGQQSRVALARALVAAPRLLLLDEPFAALDALTRESLQEELLALCESKGVTALFITHDIAEAVYLSDRIIVLRQGVAAAEFTVPQQEKRQGYERRYSREFNRICLDIRRTMEGACGDEADR